MLHSGISRVFTARDLALSKLMIQDRELSKLSVKVGIMNRLDGTNDNLPACVFNFMQPPLFLVYDDILL